MKKPVFLFLVFLCFPLSASPVSPGKTIENGINAFACDLYSQLRSEKGNLFFSPLSISYALSVTGAGARGETVAQMERVLHTPLGKERDYQTFSDMMRRLNAAQNDEQVRIEIANSLWPSNTFPLRTEYVAMANKYYETSIFPLEGVKPINHWVEEKTQGRVRDFLDSLHPSTVLVLVNSIYFNGRWLLPFDAKLTAQASFHAPEKVAEVPFMSQKAAFRYGQMENVQLLELPYKGEAFSMLVLLPSETPGAFEKLEKELSTKRLAEWTYALSKQNVQVFFPKFKMTWGTNSLINPLINLGIRDAFSSKADFSGISSQKGLSISEVFHQAQVEVDEGGTVAAAATAVVATRSQLLSVPVFRADRPFLFFIRENAKGTVLFAGRVMNPLGGAE
ncbi:MAG: serpin family protein [Burkholderiales bacterium]|jgi:serpin B|nr:serpin family protein [Burkholderiales bacterium]